MLKRISMILLSAMLGACMPNTPSEQLTYTGLLPLEFGGQLILPGGELMSEQDFRYFFRRTEYVLLGESHTSMTDHVSQAVLLDRLARQRLRPVLALEMLDVEMQPVLDSYNNGGMSLDELEKTLDWSKNVGYAFDLYRPVLEVAHRHAIPLYALNIPRRVAREARLKGLDGVNANDRKYIPKTYMPASEAQQIKLRRFFGQHGLAMPAAMPPLSGISGAMQTKSDVAARQPQNGSSSKKDTMGSSPDPALQHLERQNIINGYIRAQSLWDSAMAARAFILHAQTGRPVVIIAGVGHVEHGWGIALRLRNLEPTARITGIMPWRIPMKTAFADTGTSPLLAPEGNSGDSEELPTPDLGDAFYYSPPDYMGKGSQGMVTGYANASPSAPLAVLELDEGSAAQKSGLMPGDIILRLGERPVRSNEEFYTLLASLRFYKYPARIVVLRGQEEKEIILSDK